MSSDRDLGEWFMAAIGAAVIVVLLIVYASYWTQAVRACDRAGGVLVRGTGGLRCVTEAPGLR